MASNCVKELKAVVTEFENLKKLLAPFRVGLLHGRLKSADLKDRTCVSVALRRPLLGAVENAEDRDHVSVLGIDDQIVPVHNHLSRARNAA